MYYIVFALAMAYMIWYRFANPMVTTTQLIIELWWLYVIAILGLGGGRFLTS